MNMNLNAIGLEVEKAENLSAKLNQLLANYQVFYINVRGFHWNIKGDKFFELHIKFEELYNDLQLKNDEIAERILTLGNTPFHSYTDYLKNSKIKEVTDISDGNQSVAEILNAFKVIIKLQREILADSDKAADEGTNALMSNYVREQEKLVWMYSSFLGDKILS
ncbi:Dps family protein [Prolixibacter sp. SD074]|jgi:starvation-inducible DNA-binding protein|uniref:Dps family protein n=1 Tax=Prolixibacter sp. SD074 TaxID=2652391 RepID=UPI001271BEDA|nr:Dps family protein [Prolixibacter sp. SD074]GET29946.1 DNA starvation/stationary phase protection protein [Prolixibacter sp. SD074]